MRRVHTRVPCLWTGCIRHGILSPEDTTCFPTSSDAPLRRYIVAFLCSRQSFICTQLLGNRRAEDRGAMTVIVHSSISAVPLLQRQKVMPSLVSHHSARSNRAVIRPVSYKASRGLSAIRASVSGAEEGGDGRVRTITSCEYSE